MSTTEQPAPQPTDPAGATAITAADLPPSPPPSKRRGMGSFRSMIVSMLVLLAMLFAFYAIVPRPERMDRLPVDAVAAVANARQVGGAPFAAVEPMPAGWTANSATFAPAADGTRTWSVGYLHDGRYNGLKQAVGAPQKWYTAQLSGLRREGSTTVGGSAWERWVDADTPEYRLVKRGTGSALSTVVVSSQSYEDAAAFAARLTPAP